MSRVPKPCKAGKSGSTTPLHGPYFQTHDWFLKLGGAFSWVRTSEIWQESDATLAPLHSFIPWTWTWTLVQTPCDQFFCSQSIGSLDFGVSVVLDPKVNPPLLILEFRLRPWFKPLPAQHFSTTITIKWILLFTGAQTLQSGRLMVLFSRNGTGKPTAASCVFHSSSASFSSASRQPSIICLAASTSVAVNVSQMQVLVAAPRFVGCNTQTKIKRRSVRWRIHNNGLLFCRFPNLNSALFKPQRSRTF